MLAKLNGELNTRQNHTEGTLCVWPSAGLVSPLKELLSSSLVLAEDWEALPAEYQADLKACITVGEALPLLVKHGLLTNYQADRIESGQSFGLVLNNYRVLS